MKKTFIIGIGLLCIWANIAVGQQSQSNLQLTITNKKLHLDDYFLGVNITLKNNSHKEMELPEFNNYSNARAWESYLADTLRTMEAEIKSAAWIVFIEDSTGKMVTPSTSYVYDVAYDLDIDFEYEEVIAWSKRNSLDPLNNKTLESNRYSRYLNAAHMLPGKFRFHYLMFLLDSFYFGKLNKDKKYYLRVGYICTNKFKDELIEKYHYPSDLIFTGYVLSNKVPLTVE